MLIKAKPLVRFKKQLSENNITTTTSDWERTVANNIQTFINI